MQTVNFRQDRISCKNQVHTQGFITKEIKRKDTAENENSVFTHVLERCPTPQKGSNTHTTSSTSSPLILSFIAIFT